MASMPYQKNYNLKKNIDKLNIKTFMIIIINNKISSNLSINSLYLNTLSKEISMLMKHLIHNLNLNKEDLIMVFKSKKVIFLILIFKYSLFSKYLLEGQLYQQLINFNKKNKKFKKSKNFKLIRKNVTLNLWLLKDFKLKVKERNNKVKEEYYKSKYLLKIKNKLVKR